MSSLKKVLGQCQVGVLEIISFLEKDCENKKYVGKRYKDFALEVSYFP